MTEVAKVHRAGIDLQETYEWGRATVASIAAEQQRTADPAWHRRSANGGCRTSPIGPGRAEGLAFHDPA